MLVGPALHYWYQTLGRVVTATGSSGPTRAQSMPVLSLPVCVLLMAMAEVQGHALVCNCRKTLVSSLLTATHAHMLRWLVAGAVIRMMMDQLLFAPFFLSTFITSLMTLEVRMHLFAVPLCDAC